MEKINETNKKEKNNGLTEEERKLLWYGIKTPISVNDEDDIIYEKLDNESIIKIMLNQKWKWNHYKDELITDLEKLVHYYRNTYLNIAVLTIYENRNLDKATSVPFPEMDVDLRAAKQTYIKHKTIPEPDLEAERI